MLVRIHNLSLGGCLVEAPYEVEIGDRLTLHLDLPGEGRFSLQGETVRLHERYGFAVRFVDIDGPSRARLEHAIARLLALSPGEDWILDAGASRP
jgi:hypothetical protein